MASGELCMIGTGWLISHLPINWSIKANDVECVLCVQGPVLRARSGVTVPYRKPKVWIRFDPRDLSGHHPIYG